MNKKPLIEYANKLERVLRAYLNCNFNDFGVKANDDLLSDDWRSPINFALGHKYANSNNSVKLKTEIEYFLGDELIGRNMQDIIKNYEYYALESEDQVYERIDNIIKSLENILNK